MAWIESHENLEKNGRLIKLARFLGINIYQAIGHMHAFWWWSLHNAGRNGDLSEYDAETISRAAGWNCHVDECRMGREKGPNEYPDAYAFCHALCHVGFVDVSHDVCIDANKPLGNGAKIHQWEKYSKRYFDWVESIENRRESERMRQRKRRDSVRKMSRSVKRDSTRPNQTRPDLTRPNRINKTPYNPPLGDDTPPDINIKEKIEKLVALWNKRADAVLPRVTVLTEKRRKHVGARLREYPQAEFWIAVIDRVNASPLLRGEKGDRAWKASFDWILNPNNLAKIVEGNYDENKRHDADNKTIDYYVGKGDREENKVRGGLPEL